jgi:aminobenzoyl-glutamate transport protein
MDIANGSSAVFNRAIRWVERVGNYLPHPFFLFIILIGVLFVLSFLLHLAGLQTSVTAIDPATKQPVVETVAVVNLFEREIFQNLITNFVQTFIYFAPVGLVTIMIIGVGLAEQTGFFSALIRLIVRKTPPAYVTFVLAVASICANIASDAGIVIAPAIGAAVFLALGRHPIAGVCTGYVAAYGGYSANVFVAGTDVALAGITESAIQFMNVDVPVHPLMNWYVMMGSTLLLASVVTLVTEKVVVPLLGDYDPPDEYRLENAHESLSLDPEEKRGLKIAAVAIVLYILVVLIMAVPEDGLLRNDEGGLLPRSPLISGIIFILFVFFFVVGVSYGFGSGSIRSTHEIPRLMARGLSGVAGFLVVCIPAAVFIDLFHKSNLTTIIAIEGANLFKVIDIGIIPMLLLFALLCALLNIFITSGLTQWMITAPIFVPLFYELGLSPAITQMAFRIGDSTTNIISPISAYLPMLLGLLEKYRNKDQEIGIGSAISLMLPYSLAALVFWSLFLGMWLFLGLDPGPGVSIFVDGGAPLAASGAE